MQLTREILSRVCEQHAVNEDTDKLITRFCTTLDRNRTEASGILARLKQYTLWLRSEDLSLEDSSMAVLERYAELMNACAFTVGRKSLRLVAILKFLAWCKSNGFVDWDDTGKPLSMDELIRRPIFNVEPDSDPQHLYRAAADHYARGTPERGFAVMRLSGVTYLDMMNVALQDLNVDSRLRITAPNIVIHTPEFQDREDVLLFLNKESKLKLTDPIPPHLKTRAVINRASQVYASIAGRYEALVQLIGIYATTKDPKVALFIELHFPNNQSATRYKKCKWLSAGRAAMASSGRMTSGMIIASYRERLPWCTS